METRSTSYADIFVMGIKFGKETDGIKIINPI